LYWIVSEVEDLDFSEKVKYKFRNDKGVFENSRNELDRKIVKLPV
jgi:hypothetical protein